jgi:hypothetical protein
LRSYAIDVDPETSDVVVGSTDSVPRVFTRAPRRLAAAAELASFEELSGAIVAAAAASAATGGDGGGGGEFQNLISVGTSGGTALTVGWNPGESPATVADRFIAGNKLGTDQREGLIQHITYEMQQPPTPMPSSTGMDTSGSGGGGGGHTHSYPVEFDAGTKLTIEWNTGDDPRVVAERFLTSHGLPLAQLEDIVNFVKTAPPNGSGGGGSGISGSLPAPPPSISATDQEGRIGQLTAMGFDAVRARQALAGVGWSVETALAVLLG